MRRDSYQVKREEFLNHTSKLCIKTALSRKGCVRGSMVGVDHVDPKDSIDRDSR